MHNIESLINVPLPDVFHFPPDAIVMVAHTGTLLVSLQTEILEPALTLGPLKKFIITRSVSAGQNPLPVVIRYKVSFPFITDDGKGV